MYRHHMSDGIDVEAVFGGAVAQGIGNGNGQLFEQWIENGEARN